VSSVMFDVSDEGMYGRVGVECEISVGIVIESHSL